MKDRQHCTARFLGFLCISWSMLLPIFMKAQDTATILKSISVIGSSADEIQDAEHKAELLIKDVNQVVPLFEKFTLIGANLWKKIKDDPNFRDIKQGNITFKIPKFNENGEWVSKEDVTGKALQEILDYLKMWTYLKTNYNLDKGLVVEENTRDKFIMWLYFAKIEEPIVTIQTDNARLILKFVKGKLFFIDLTN